MKEFWKSYWAEARSKPIKDARTMSVRLPVTQHHCDSQRVHLCETKHTRTGIRTLLSDFQQLPGML